MGNEINLETESIVFDKEDIEQFKLVQKKYAFKDLLEMIRFFVSLGEACSGPRFIITKKTDEYATVIPSIYSIKELTPENKALFDSVADEDSETMMKNMQKIRKKLEELDFEQFIVFLIHTCHLETFGLMKKEANKVRTSFF